MPRRAAIKYSPITKLYRKSLETVSRELNHLNTLSIGGKLSPSQALDLARYVKLFQEMVKAEDKAQAERKAATEKEKANAPDTDLLAALAQDKP